MTTTNPRSLSRRCWVTKILLPPLVLGVVTYTMLLTIVGVELDEHMGEPAAPVPDPCTVVDRDTMAQLFPDRDPERSRHSDSFDSRFSDVTEPSPSDLVKRERSCHWEVHIPWGQPTVFVGGTEGLHVIVQQYENRRAARYVQSGILSGKDIELPSADRAVLRTTDYRMEYDPDESGLVDSAISSIVIRKGKVLAVVTFARAPRDGAESDPVSRADGNDGITAITEQVLEQLGDDVTE